MTNITPQAHGMNAGPWEKLEIYCRQLAQAGNELFIYCGHGFSSATHGTIGPNKIAVPDFGWKIVVVVPPGSGDPVKRVRPTTRVIAVRMPNINTISKKDWREFRVSVGDIEKATGLVFFDALPKDVAAALKDRVDFDQSAPSRVRRHRAGSDRDRWRRSCRRWPGVSGEHHRCLGEHSQRCLLAAGDALLWQDQTGQVYERSGCDQGWVSRGGRPLKTSA